MQRDEWIVFFVIGVCCLGMDGKNVLVVCVCWVGRGCVSYSGICFVRQDNACMAEEKRRERRFLCTVHRHAQWLVVYPPPRLFLVSQPALFSYNCISCACCMTFVVDRRYCYSQYTPSFAVPVCPTPATSHTRAKHDSNEKQTASPLVAPQNPTPNSPLLLPFALRPASSSYWSFFTLVHTCTASGHR